MTIIRIPIRKELQAYRKIKEEKSDYENARDDETVDKSEWPLDFEEEMEYSNEIRERTGMDGEQVIFEGESTD